MVLPHEAEAMVEQLRVLELDAMGASDWMRYHGDVEKLNLQAHQSAKQKADNFVVEALLTFKKLDVLVRNLLTTELWADDVFPHVAASDVSDATSLRTYFLLYHEAVVCNLLEVAFFHEHVFEALDDDSLVEVLDYVMRKVTWILSTPRDVFKTQTTFHKAGAAVVAELSSASRAAELTRQRLELGFRIAVQCVTILRYFCERVHVLSLTLLTRLLDKHDVLLSLVALIENPPWTYKDGEGRWKKFHDQKWVVVPAADLLALTTTEAQPWLGVYFLTCSKVSRDQYQLTSFRKSQLLRVRKYLNDVLVDQLPLLTDVQRFLDELAIVNLPSSSQVMSQTRLVLEAVPILRAQLQRAYKGRHEEIAAHFLAACRQLSRQDDMAYLADVYNMDGLDDLLDDKIDATKKPQAVEVLPPAMTTPTLRDKPRRATIALVVKTNPSIKIVELGAHDDVHMDATVDASSETRVETTHGPYFRFNVEQAPTNGTAVPLHAVVDATIELATGAKVQLHCADIGLETPTEVPSACWRQAGSLDDGHGILQVQFKWDSALDAFVVGSLFLSLPADK
ncbi:hypothetical protein SPRG_03587 [Saprolegnia parasitica CBS 223.65]|uniref:Uncharacterized protein n=1 Tax=Saprolegnia parasitica (strain CBS 223.65) TaxID=695850 RepID=A0A067CMG0_SAPPC|nr:hypothetical protein SPRG_03587 [Saprolegnia parasitica CBS 223.65]KDO31668.1 hypothetical protein SPRG_03587 [Saprolegnia parasitica CBS 223.65]|eukprot:XP_012197556.1 hypothetical protein SPRG_03587 [Saprolegnia parasitica CBS 223.65]